MVVRGGIRCHFDASGIVVDPGKSEDKDHVYAQRYQDEKQDFAGFETEVHCFGLWDGVKSWQLQLAVGSW